MNGTRSQGQLELAAWLARMLGLALTGGAIWGARSSASTNYVVVALVAGLALMVLGEWLGRRSESGGS